MATTSKNKRQITIPLPTNINLTGILVVLLIISSFFLGALFTKLSYLKNSSNTATAQPQNNQITPNPQAAPAQDTSPKEVSIDDDPILGDKNAPVTLIEFSDYECPFCKKYFDETYSKIKTDYVDTGKVKIVFRDLPLSFHNPLATKQANAANCARAQGTDETYFAYHDQIFTKTTSNGNGMTEDTLYTIATDLGLNADVLRECVTAETYKEEIEKDIADGAKIGATGTPSFFIGKSTENGVISGTPLIGAYPYQNFKELIDKNL